MRRSALLVLCAVMCLTTTPAVGSWYDDYAAGIKAARDGDWPAVIEKMTRAIASVPRENSKQRTYGAIFISYHPYYYRGIAYFQLGEKEKALADLERSTGKGELDLGEIDSYLRQLPRTVETSPPPVMQPSPGPPPVTTAPMPRMSPPPVTAPTRPPKTFLADQVLKASGSIAFNAPEKMQVGERAVIQLLLDPRQTIPELLGREITEPGRVESARIKISESIEAKLSGDAFYIRPVTPELQALSAEEATEWKWEVMPKEAGTQRLFLTINAIVTESGQKRSVRTFDRQIVVQVPAAPSQRVTPTSVETPKTSSFPWVALVLLGALLATFILVRRRVAPPATTTQSDQPTLILKDDSGGWLEPGQIVANRYEIERFVGRGGMGGVYAARDREFAGERVALKTILPNVASERSAERFRREIQYSRKVAHPNVCRIHDLGYHGAQMFVTMEYVEGKTLSELLRARGPLSEDEALPIIEQITAALDETHRAGLVHRDLKTANIMLADDGRRAVLMDFGLACLASAAPGVESLTQTGAVVGSPMYMAPEQIEGGEVTPATDIYALGTVLYQMLTGALPFEGDTPVSVIAKRLREPPIPPSQRMPSISATAEAVILKCLARNPAERFQKARDVYAALCT